LPMSDGFLIVSEALHEGQATECECAMRDGPSCQVDARNEQTRTARFASGGLLADRSQSIPTGCRDAAAPKRVNICCS
jgi:hypothetical protein